MGSFVKAVFWRLVGPALAITAGLAWMTAIPAMGQQGDEVRSISYMDLTGPVDPPASRFLVEQIEKASRQRALALIVRLDTPGGLDIAVDDLVEAIRSSRVPVVVWVAPGAATAQSAGAFIALSAHVTVMNPDANLGPALPPDFGRRKGAIRTEGADEVSLERLVRQKSGGRADSAQVADRGLSAAAAGRQKLADFTATNLSDLLGGLSGREVVVEGRAIRFPAGGFLPQFQKMPLLSRMLHAAVSPGSAYLLLLLGFFALVFELYNPGVGGAGLFGGTALIFSIYGFSILPASWLGIALVVMGLSLLLRDLHISRLGPMSAAGSAVFVIGSLLVTKDAPPIFQLRWWAVAAGLAGALAFFFGAMPAAIRARTAKPLSGAENIVGKRGVARTDISPEGQVMAGGTLWRARTLGAAIAQGHSVEIKGVSGTLLVVEPADEPADHSD